LPICKPYGNFQLSSVLFINIHTHIQTDKNVFALLQYESDHMYPSEQPISVGLHPWHVSENWESELKSMMGLLKQNKVWAIGECGLDALCDKDLNLQAKVFSAQIEAANLTNKPMIIHCVKAYDNVLLLLKMKPEVKAVFHGFNKNKELAKQLTDKGYFLSFGAALMHERNRQTLKAINPKQILLETDYAALSIAEIYRLAALALGISTEALQMQIFENCTTFFGKKPFLGHD
jgi:TatD DNase family protein